MSVGRATPNRKRLVQELGAVDHVGDGGDDPGGGRWRGRSLGALDGEPQERLGELRERWSLTPDEMAEVVDRGVEHLRDHPQRVQLIAHPWVSRRLHAFGFPFPPLFKARGKLSFFWFHVADGLRSRDPQNITPIADWSVLLARSVPYVFSIKNHSSNCFTFPSEQSICLSTQQEDFDLFHN